jgi:dienelactone hydrolase
MPLAPTVLVCWNPQTDQGDSMKTGLAVAAALTLLAAVITALAARESAVAQEGVVKIDVQSRAVAYKDGETECEGFVAWDAGRKGARPVVLVVHDWMGRGEFDEARARDLAALADANADKTRVAILGYCFGGTCALELARSGADIDGAISFHGGLDSDSPADAKNIKGKVLVLHGADDPFADLESVLALNLEMREAGVDYQVVLYGHAVHSFTNPKAGTDNSKGAAYNEKADKRSWEAMKNFLAEALK